jgi:hypothetical protein
LANAWSAGRVSETKAKEDGMHGFGPQGYEHWITVGVTLLPPGWQNLHRDSAGAVDARDPSPALLLQEHRANGVDRLPCEPPYGTRVVFATYSVDMAWLEPASDSISYVGTIGPGQVPGDILDESES